MIKIGLIDYGVGNLGSIRNAFSFLGCPIKVEKNYVKLKEYDKLILPGVGAFGDAIKTIEKKGFRQEILDFAKSGKFLLGICLGMQLLFEKSYEFGEHKGLGILQGEVVKFKKAPKIPHIGWNQCLFTKQGKNHPLLKNIKDKEYLYFVHSFHISQSIQALMICEYGESFPAIVAKENIFGIQPHPEKSHNAGLQILKNFIEI